MGEKKVSKERRIKRIANYSCTINRIYFTISKRLTLNNNEFKNKKQKLTSAEGGITSKKIET